jgi:hypothetical protein
MGRRRERGRVVAGVAEPGPFVCVECREPAVGPAAAILAEALVCVPCWATVLEEMHAPSSA